MVINLFQVKFFLRLQKQLAARHLRQRDLLLEAAAFEFILNEIFQRLIRQAAVGAVARKIIFKRRAGGREVQLQPLGGDGDGFFLVVPNEFQSLDRAFEIRLT